MISLLAGSLRNSLVHLNPRENQDGWVVMGDVAPATPVSGASSDFFLHMKVQKAQANEQMI